MESELKKKKKKMKKINTGHVREESTKNLKSKTSLNSLVFGGREYMENVDQEGKFLLETYARDHLSSPD